MSVSTTYLDQRFNNGPLSTLANLETNRRASKHQLNQTHGDLTPTATSKSVLSTVRSSTSTRVELDSETEPTTPMNNSSSMSRPRQLFQEKTREFLLPLRKSETVNTDLSQERLKEPQLNFSTSLTQQVSSKWPPTRTSSGEPIAMESLLSDPTVARTGEEQEHTSPPLPRSEHIKSR